jgi:hypothetical protein
MERLSFYLEDTNVNSDETRSRVTFSPNEDSYSLLAFAVRPLKPITSYLADRNDIVGVLLGFTLIQPSDIHGMQTHLTLLMESYDISFPELPEFDFSRVDSEWQKIRNSIPEFWKLNKDGREFAVGEAAKERGLSAEFPVVLIPGIVSTVRLPSHQNTSHVHISTGAGIVVNLSRLSSFLPRKTLGRFQHDLTSYI